MKNKNIIFKIRLYFTKKETSIMLQTTDSGTKFCQHCGKEVMRDTVICPNCGCPTTVDGNQENVGLYNCAFIFSLVFPIVGTVLSIIGGCVCKTKAFRKGYLYTFLFSILMMVIYALLFNWLKIPLRIPHLKIII